MSCSFATIQWSILVIRMTIASYHSQCQGDHEEKKEYKEKCLGQKAGHWNTDPETKYRCNDRQYQKYCGSA